MNLDRDPHLDDPAAAKPAKKRKTRECQCKHPFCLKKGHLTTRSKKCLANPERLAREGLVQACAKAVNDAAVANETPLAVANSNHDGDEPLHFGDGSTELFHDAGTWSEDEEGNVISGAI